jgi:hypothetical protein
MAQRNDGGPAFPDAVAVSPSGDAYYGTSAGMSLRDWFAGQALINVQGTNPNLPDSPASARFWPESHELARRQATWAYMVADAMIAERDK